MPMGSMSFKIPGLGDFDERFLTTAHVSGIEGVPWAGRITTKGDTLTILRAIEESGKMQIVWPTLTRGPMQLSTASLRCNQEPYFLPRELARGGMDRLSSRFSEWSRWGIQPPENFFELYEFARDYFVDSIVAADDYHAAAQAAQHSIEYELAASRLLCQTFSRQLLANRNKNEGQLATLMGSKLPFHENWHATAERIKPVLNTAWIDASWHNVRLKSGRLDIERLEEQCGWCSDQQMRVLAGPLVSLQPHAIQEWFFVMDHFEAIVDAACEYAEEIVKRLRGRVNLWYVASGFNTPNELNLNEEQTMLLAVNLLQAVRNADPMTPVVFGIDMPYGEYLGQDEKAISPLHFADALIRSDIGLNGLVLEMNHGVWPHGTPLHDSIDFSNLLDLWSTLGLPLVLSMSGEVFPAPKQSLSRYGAISDWRLPTPPSNTEAMQGLVRQSSCSQIFESLTLAISKPCVHGVFWNQPDPETSPFYPASSLVDAKGNVSDLMTGMANLRKRHLL